MICDIAEWVTIRRGVLCRFVARDLTEIVQDLECSFGFGYDWEVLHHVFPERRGQYADNVHRMLRPGGKYLKNIRTVEIAGKRGTQAVFNFAARLM